MSELDQFFSRGSSGSYTRKRSTPFRVYLTLGKTPGVECTLAQGGHLYYRSLGFGLASKFYNKSGAAAWSQAECNAEIDSSYAIDAFSYMDLYYADYEGTYYNFSVADAATCIADTNSVISWANTRLAAKGIAGPYYLGIYTTNGGGGATKGPVAAHSPYWLHSPAQRASWRADNLACAAIQSAWSFLCPEIYTYKLDQFAMKAEIFSEEKAAVGGTAKLIPMFQPTISGNSCTSSQMYNVLRYAYATPEIDGLILWSVFKDPSAAPIYYDDQDWMIGAKQFMVDYGITRGTPF